jgi:diguanylate cyclase (GGDEF)-like protein
MLQSVDLELLQYATRVGTLLAVGALVGEFSTLRDRERERLIQRFDNMAHTDELTGLLNRRGWERALERDLARAGRDRSAPSVILIDLDRFKEYNDEGGHPHGDRFLGDAARAWGAVLRRGDVLARVGGDEFAAILAPIAEEARAEEISERLLRATPHGQSCSIGLARWNGRETPGQLLRRADLALYRAKRMGRGRVVSAETPTQPVSARRSASNPG